MISLVLMMNILRDIWNVCNYAIHFDSRFLQNIMMHETWTLTLLTLERIPHMVICFALQDLYTEIVLYIRCIVYCIILVLFLTFTERMTTVIYVYFIGLWTLYSFLEPVLSDALYFLASKRDKPDLYLLYNLSIELSKQGFPDFEAIYLTREPTESYASYISGYFIFKRLYLSADLFDCLLCGDKNCSSRRIPCVPDYQEWAEPGGKRMIKEFTFNETLALTASQLYRQNDPTNLLILSCLAMFVIWLLCIVLYNSRLLLATFCLSGANHPVVAIYLIYEYFYWPLYHIVFIPFRNVISKLLVYRADRMVKQQFGLGEELIDALIKVSIGSREYPMRGSWYTLFLKENPNIMDRIDYLKQ